jgi:exosortase H (IPTLxxWG-CTERM-specific)
MRTRFGSAVVFLVVLVAGGALLLSDAAQDGPLRTLSIWITTLSAGLLSALGFAVEPRGQELIAIGRPFGVSVQNDCNGAWAHLVLLASVLAYPATPREKVRGLLVAQLALFALNVVRVASLFVIGLHAPGLFRAAHVYVWQGLIIACAIVLFLVWIERGVRAPA